MAKNIPLEGQLSFFDAEKITVSEPVKSSIKKSQTKFKYEIYVNAWRSSVIVSAYTERQARFLFHKEYGSVYIDNVVCIG